MNIKLHTVDRKLFNFLSKLTQRSKFRIITNNILKHMILIDHIITMINKNIMIYLIKF
jgi:hypothetical protein